MAGSGAVAQNLHRRSVVAVLAGGPPRYARDGPLSSCDFDPSTRAAGEAGRLPLQLTSGRCAPLHAERTGAVGQQSQNQFLSERASLLTVTRSASRLPVGRLRCYGRGAADFPESEDRLRAEL
jgi:hypothetical protein